MRGVTIRNAMAGFIAITVGLVPTHAYATIGSSNADSDSSSGTVTVEIGRAHV